MKFEKTTLLNSFKFISSLFLMFLVIIFMNILFNENLELSTLIQIKLKKEKMNKIKTCGNKSFKDILLGFESVSNCNKIGSNISYILTLPENRYVYYSFALTLGGVLNMRKIVKTGIF